MATHSSTLAWKIPWMEEPGRLQFMRSRRGRLDWATNFAFPFHFHALEREMATHSKCSCLENPRDGGAWWAAVYGVAQSRTRLKWLSSSSSSRDKGMLAFGGRDVIQPNMSLVWKFAKTVIYLLLSLNRPSEDGDSKDLLSLWLALINLGF